MILPTHRFFKVALIASFVLFIASPWALWLLLLIGIEVLRLPSRQTLKVQRHVPSFTTLGRPIEVEVTIENLSSKKTISGCFFDELHPDCLRKAVVHAFTLKPKETLTVKTETSPMKRGNLPLGAIVIRMNGPWGFFLKEERFALGEQLEVYPGESGETKRLTCPISERIKPTQGLTLSIARGGEFEGLRHHIPGEDQKNIDWKISAKRQRWVCRTWQEDFQHQVVGLIDCGWQMAEKIGAYSRLDHVLQAIVQLAASVQKEQDAFACAAFSNQIEAALPFIRGKSTVSSVQKALYCLQPRSLTADYWNTLGKALQMAKKRSLIILFTDLLDPTNTKGLCHHLIHTARHHLVLCVVMEDPLLRADTQFKDAASSLLKERARALEKMQSLGAHVLEVTPDTFAEDLVNRYLTIREAIA